MLHLYFHRDAQAVNDSSFMIQTGNFLIADRLLLQANWFALFLTRIDCNKISSKLMHKLMSVQGIMIEKAYRLAIVE